MQKLFFLLFCFFSMKFFTPELHAADFYTCVEGYYEPGSGLPTADIYTFPQVLTCNVLEPSDVTLTPADAGTITDVVCTSSASGCSPKIYVQWAKAGVHEIRVTYSCGILGTTERIRTVDVAMESVNYSAHTLSLTNTCPYPGTSIVINRTNTDGILKRHWIDVFEVNPSTGAYNNGLWYSTNWVNGSFTSKTISATGNNINFQVGKTYRIKLAVQTSCSNWQETISPAFQIKDCRPTASVKINNSSASPIDLFTCNSAPMIVNNQSSVTQGGTPITQMRFTLLNSNTNCTLVGTIAGGPTPIAVLSTYSLRNLYSSQMNTPGWYKILVEAYNTYGWSNAYERCIRVNSAVQSNADFKFIGSPSISGGLPIPRTPLTDFYGAEVGQLSLGITLTDIVNLAAVDWYQVQIWETNPTTGANVSTVFTSAQIPAPLPNSYNFNDPTVTNGFFFNLSQTNVTNKRFKVRLTVANECGTSFQESYFHIRPNCQFCKNEVVSGITTHIAPNPVTEQAVLHVLSSQAASAKLSIMDIYGRSVAAPTHLLLESGENSLPLDCNHLVPGIYFYQLIVGDEKIAGKFVKQ